MNPKPLLIGLALLAAFSPPATRPDTAAPPAASAPAAATAPAAGIPPSPAPPSEPAKASPPRFEPTEKTRADYAISFPSDI